MRGASDRAVGGCIRRRSGRRCERPAPAWTYVANVQAGRARYRDIARRAERASPTLSASSDLRAIVNEKAELDVHLSLQRALRAWLLLHVPAGHRACSACSPSTSSRRCTSDGRRDSLPARRFRRSARASGTRTSSISAGRRRAAAPASTATATRSRIHAYIFPLAHQSAAEVVAGRRALLRRGAPRSLR